MRRTTAAHVLLLTALFAAATAVAGWLAVPLVAVAAGASGARGRAAALGAALGWGALLLVSAARGGAVWPLAGRLGGVLQLPAAAVVGVTLAYAALLAGPAAVLGGAARARVRRRARGADAAAADRAA